MLRVLFAFAAAFCSTTAADTVPTLKYELLPYNPVADPAAVVTFDQARFTVLTSRLLRLEFSPDGTFEDRPSLAFVNRCVDSPPASSCEL